MVLIIIGIMALIGAVLLLASSIQAIISLGFALILKMILGLAGIICGILLLLFVVFLAEEVMNDR